MRLTLILLSTKRREFFFKRTSEAFERDLPKGTLGDLVFDQVSIAFENGKVVSVSVD